MDLNALSKSLSDGIIFLGKLQETLAENANPSNVHGNISGTVAIVKTLQGAAMSFAKLIAASDQMVSYAELADLLRRLATVYTEVVKTASDRLDLSQVAKDDHRYFVVDQTSTLFTEAMEQWHEEITTRRRSGIGALSNPKLLED